MAKIQLLVGSTSNTINVFIQDSSSTVGAGLGGLVYNSSGLTAYYALPRAAPVAITLATQTVTGAFSSGGFVELDATHTKGLYRLDIPDAAVASGRFANIYLYGATNMAPVILEIELTATNNQDAVRMGMTALPNAAANAAGGLPVSSAGGLDLDEMNVDIEAIQTSTAGLTFTGAGKVDASVRDWVGDTIPARNVTGVPIVDWKYILGSAITGTAAQLAAAITKWFNVATPTGTVNSLPDAVPGAAGGLPVSTAGGLDLDEMNVDIEAIQAKTDNLPALPASTTNITAGIITTVTSLTNAPTVGDLTAAMKTSVQTAADAAVSANALVLEIEADTDTLTTGVIVTTNNDKTGYALTAGERNAVADALLARNVAGGSSSGRIVKDAIAALRNKVTIVAGTLTVYDVDDTTVLWTATVTTAAGDPLASVDPS